MRAQRVVNLMIGVEEDIEFVPRGEKIVVEPYPFKNFFLTSNNALNLYIGHPFVINLLLNFLEPSFLPSWAMV